MGNMRHFSEVVFNSEAGENPKKIFMYVSFPPALVSSKIVGFPQLALTHLAPGIRGLYTP